MTTKNKNWYTHPTKTTLLILFSVWFLGGFFTLLSVTDSFQEALDWDKLSFNWWALGGSSLFVFEMFIRYLKNKKENEMKSQNKK